MVLWYRPVFPSSSKRNVLLFVSVIVTIAPLAGGSSSSKKGADKVSFICCSSPVVSLNQLIEASITRRGSVEFKFTSITSSQDVNAVKSNIAASFLILLKFKVQLNHA